MEQITAMEKRSEVIEQRMVTGFKRLGAGDISQPSPKVPRLALQIPEDRSVEGSEIPNKTPRRENASLPDSRYKSRERSRSKKPRNDLEKAPTKHSDKTKPKTQRDSPKNTKCPFCGTTDCARPNMCGMMLPLKKRLDIHRELELCPDFKCYKSHKTACRKKAMRCTICNGTHHVLWCRQGEKIFNDKEKAMEDEEDQPGPSK